MKLGADLGVEDHNGNSPLVYAVYHSRRQTVKWIKWRNWSERQQASNNLNDSVYSPSASFGSEPGGGLPAHDGTGWVDGDNATLDANTSIVSVLSHNSADSSASYASTTRPYSWKGLPSQMQDGIHTGMHALMTNNCPLSPRTQNHFTAIPSNSRRGDGHETRPITPPSPPTMPEFAWRECKKMRQLAGLVNLVAPGLCPLLLSVAYYFCVAVKLSAHLAVTWLVLHALLYRTYRTWLARTALISSKLSANIARTCSSFSHISHAHRLQCSYRLHALLYLAQAQCAHRWHTLLYL